MARTIEQRAKDLFKKRRAGGCSQIAAFDWATGEYRSEIAALSARLAEAEEVLRMVRRNFIHSDSSARKAALDAVDAFLSKEKNDGD